MKAMGLDLQEPEPGCCGLAGSFGFEADHYDISMKIGDRALLPGVRAERDTTLILADGFSCREQFVHGSGRHAYHLAEVIAAILDEAGHSLRLPTTGDSASPDPAGFLLQTRPC